MYISSVVWSLAHLRINANESSSVTTQRPGLCQCLCDTLKLTKQHHSALSADPCGLTGSARGHTARAGGNQLSRPQAHGLSPCLCCQPPRRQRISPADTPELGSWGRCNKSPQPGWPQTRPICCLMVLKSEIQTPLHQAEINVLTGPLPLVLGENLLSCLAQLLELCFLIHGPLQGQHRAREASSCRHLPPPSVLC